MDVITTNRADAEATAREDLDIRIVKTVTRIAGIEAAERFYDAIEEVVTDEWNGRTIIASLWVEDPDAVLFEEDGIPRTMWDVGLDTGWHIGRA